MSKKILKRSLALGALMAFVITGSAMASAPDGWEINPSNGWYTPVASNTDGVIQSGEYYCKFLGDYGKNIHVDGGKVKIGADVTIQKGNSLQGAGGVYGGYSESTSLQPVVKNCIVEINGGEVNSPICGGFGEGDSDTSSLVENNSVNISGGIISGSVYGGYNYGKLGDAKSNKVNVSGGIISGSVIGGNASADKANASAYNNSIDISGGTVTGDIYGAKVYAYKAKVDIVDNTVNVSGGIISGNLYAAYSDTTRSKDKSDTFTYVSNNEVNISGEANVEKANLHGFGVEKNDAHIEASNNTLNITGWKGSDVEAKKGYGTIGSAQNFNTINIIEGASAKFGTALNDAKVAVNVKGATWNVDKTNTVGSASFDKDSVLVLKGDGNQFTKAGEYALNGKGTLTVEQGAKLTVEGIDKNTYNIANGFETISKNKWQVNDLNTLMQGVWLEEEGKGLQLQVVAKEAEQMATEMGVSTSTAQSIANVTAAAQAAIENKNIVADKEGTGDAKAVAFIQAMTDQNISPEVAGQAYEAVSKMAEAGGNSATAANIVNNVTNVTGQRLSFGGGGHHGGNNGGHGVGLLEEGSGAAIWAQYVHGKDSVEDMPSGAGATSYEGQYNGIVMGVDFKKVGKFQSGIAFNYGEGDTNSVGTSARTKSEYDFWGIGYYGNIRNADTNVIFDVNYAKTDSDVSTDAADVLFEASPETTTWTAGVKVEKLYQNNNVQIVPYTGLRYMSIDPEDYSTKCGASSYQMERQDIWLLPLGVSIRQEVVNDNGWVVTPKVDLSYIWAFGDTDSEMEFTTLGIKTPVPYEVMDDGSWLGLVGVEATMDDWTFGVSYSYQKGDHSESKKWYVDAKYSF